MEFLRNSCKNCHWSQFANKRPFRVWNAPVSWKRFHCTRFRYLDFFTTREVWEIVQKIAATYNMLLLFFTYVLCWYLATILLHSYWPIFSWHRTMLRYFDAKPLLLISCIWWCLFARHSLTNLHQNLVNSSLHYTRLDYKVLLFCKFFFYYFFILEIQ